MEVPQSIIIGTSSFIGATVGSTLIVFLNFLKEKSLKKTDTIYKFTIPSTKKVYDKLSNIKAYFYAKSFEDSGCDFMKPPEELDDNKNKSTLVHVDELESILENNRLFLSHKTEKMIRNTVSSWQFLMNIELNYNDVDIKKSGKDLYKSAYKEIDKVLLNMKNELNLYF